MRYRLDDLGWFDFEKLTQALLKASLGLGVEAWGGTGDHGRDAYCAGPLCFPSRHEESPGPFLFQSKFVQHANAPGADWFPAIRGAVQKELRSLAKQATKSGWTDPAHYVLLSNVPLTAKTRQALMEILGQGLPRTLSTLYGGEDICSLLDHEPALRRSYPEILSLRDLDGLLQEAVSRGILKRSEAAVEESRDLVPVFVPTRAYYQALNTLREHSFVVLDGPPEMGKTAIARTIALAYLIDGWHAVDCRTSEDFFSAYLPGERQIFVVDDAFGRTEYDPTLGRTWERDLTRVLCRVNATHHLIWTTRQHILARALRMLDITGRAERFPAPAEVLVTASALTREEKARMLYRHCRAVQLDEQTRGLVRAHATLIVEHHDFTPERIRRFVCDSLPELARSTQDLDAYRLRQHVDQLIRHPTRRMRLAFRALGPEHKAVLLAMLESGGLAARYGGRMADRQATRGAELLSRAVAFCPTPTHPLPSCLDDVVGTFLRVRTTAEGTPWVRWIHPSYRDLVIEELALDAGLTAVFLQGASAEGIALALSRAGGATGERNLPLLQTPSAWNALATACERLAVDDPHSLDGFADELAQVATEADSLLPEGVRAKAREACTRAAVVLRSAWEGGSLPLTVQLLGSYFRLVAGSPTNQSRPAIRTLWESTMARARLQCGNGVVPETAALQDAVDLLAIAEKEYPDFADHAELANTRGEITRGILDRAKELAEWCPDPDGSEGGWYEHVAGTTRGLADVIESLPGLADHQTLIEELRGVSEQFSDAQRAWEEQQGRRDEPDAYDNPGRSEAPSGLGGLMDALFDVPALFKDL